MPVQSLELALVGNCGIALLMDERARIVWGCYPRYDGDPLFCSLLKSDDETGFFDIELAGLEESDQSYRRNTAIVDTVLTSDGGDVVRIIDYAPRFKQFGRTFRPKMLIRRIEPLSGLPRIKVRMRPRHGYGAHEPTVTHGSNHLRYVTPAMTLRLTTDAPITHILEECWFNIDRPVTLILGPDETLTGGVDEISRQFLEYTEEYWFEWCRYLSLPFEWQDEVIRAAITLKLSNFEDTGAVVAALTSSIPESPNSGRNWDYRYCWLRDSYFVVHALNRLGVTKTMEGYLRFLINAAVPVEADDLQPVFGIGQERNLDEQVLNTLDGYRGMGPVNIGNQAYKQIQNDGYGHVILAAAQSFFDRRLRNPGGISLFRKLEQLGERAAVKWNQPDSGPWEYRSRTAVHTFSAVMCWAACDRLGRIAHYLNDPKRAQYWAKQARKIRKGILDQAWNDELECLVASFDGRDIDASLLMLGDLGFLSYDDPRFVGTVQRIETSLRADHHLYRYRAEDDFGVPETTFNICSFWFIDALVGLGRYDEAREYFTNMLSSRTKLGLLSEDFDPHTGELWGNFPQTYSMVGLINSAMRLSKSWEDAF